MLRVHVAVLSALLALPRASVALDPRKALTQYTRTVYAQEQGLPQDTIRAIVQTPDGYLWLGTDEGLARFDGYEFSVFNRDRGGLPGNSVTSLAASADGTLWIGTNNGLARYRDRSFRSFGTKDGLPDNGISALVAARDGSLWIVAGVFLTHYEHGRFTTFAPGTAMPLDAVRSVYEDRAHRLWIGGFGALLKRENGRFESVLPAGFLAGEVVVNILRDRHENLWVAGTQGLIMIPPGGAPKRFSVRDGLPDAFVRWLWEDRDGAIWAGTNGGLCRFENGRFVAPLATSGGERDWVRCIYEDREGDLWVGMNTGLARYRDDLFTTYSKAEGLPSDQPTAVYQDRKGRIWVGFHDSGVMEFGPMHRCFTTRQGLASNEVFDIREDRQGALLVSTREGLCRMEDGRFRRISPPDRLGRRIVFDTLEDSRGRLWLATPAGVSELAGGQMRNLIPGGPLLNTMPVALAEGRGGTLWAGTYAKGLWRYEEGAQKLFTTADGLSSDQIRALLQDADGTLWIGTFGGLNRLRGGSFARYTSQDGLLSDNISHMEDDGRGYLWLSTTRGICRIARQQLEDFAAGRLRRLTPVNYGVQDGLRSAQCAPSYPVGGGGFRSADGRIWFPTTRGLAVVDRSGRSLPVLPAVVQVVEMTADGTAFDVGAPARVAAGDGRVQIRYVGIHLSAPERVRYAYRMEGVDKDWVPAGTRRVADYNSLRHGKYRFLVRAEIAGAAAGQAAYSFQVLPHFYETWWFRLFCALLLAGAVAGVFALRVRAIRSRFALVLAERARLAREIHDTLAQGFVGISSQLDAVAMCMPREDAPARRYLDLARKMARHSLTEARRSVMDLRASVLEGQDLGAALQVGAAMWVAGSRTAAEVEVTGPPAAMRQETEQHLLRIAQEAVTNVVKHAGASKVSVRLHREPRKVYLRIVDDGCGFDPQNAFSSAEGHFGLLGMRERAERLGGELRLESEPGRGTRLELVVPTT
jgi:signal transduction histidine kinase/ligand-binding sensor domain-containing protein